MNTFASTSVRLQKLQTRVPGFPLEKMRLLRMTYHLQKKMHDLTNALLKQHGLIDATYLVLAVLYGCENETASASELGGACHEKPANVTRVCNELERRGLIVRGHGPGDRRAVIISLTDAGRTLIATVLPQMVRGVAPIYHGFNAQEIRQLDAMFARQLHNLEHMAPA